MSWCPKCKNEYRAGITVCPDCNVELLEELTTEIEYIALFQTDNEVLKEKILSYMEHCGITSRFETSEEEVFDEDEVFEDETLDDSSSVDDSTEEPLVDDPEEELVEANEEETLEESSGTKKVTLFTILVDKSREKEASKELYALLAVEASEKGDGPTATFQKKKSVPQPSTVYVNAKDRYSEYRSSGFMFIGFGIVILLFALLNLVGVISIMAGTISLVLLGILSIAFIVIGISSLHRSKSLLFDATKEETEKEQITTYLATNFPKETIDTLITDELTPELLFLKQLELMKERTIKEFPDADELLIDTLLEDYLNSIE